MTVFICNQNGFSNRFRRAAWRAAWRASHRTSPFGTIWHRFDTVDLTVRSDHFVGLIASVHINQTLCQTIMVPLLNALKAKSHFTKVTVPRISKLRFARAIGTTSGSTSEWKIFIETPANWPLIGNQNFWFKRSSSAIHFSERVAYFGKISKNLPESCCKLS